MYKSLHDCGLTYIGNLICHSTLATGPSGLRSSVRQYTIVTRFHNKFAERAFAVACQCIWNNSPDHAIRHLHLQRFVLRFICSVSHSNRIIFVKRRCGSNCLISSSTYQYYMLPNSIFSTAYSYEKSSPAIFTTSSS